ncbi:uncharacterized protein BJX67DRAFT_373157 [Aspergillus lucknowensis]|uniref:Uroporphyrinogen-III synthase n=1 Tax=Aspergillus lucknowensis TaxID=176173 RepID=A0ABR4LLV8_9EURO
MQKCRVVNSTLGSRAVVPTPRVRFQVQRRNLQDVTITRTGKPILKVQGHTATVFGATGFLGRYIVNKLATQGCTVVIPYREEMTKRHLKVTGDLGRVIFMEYDLRNTQSIEESVRHSDVVYNLVGREYPTKNFSYTDVHVDGTERIADAVAKYDVDRFIHVSSYNANKNSPSEYFATKGWGEEVARSIYPETTIVRPAPMFGFEDRLLHKLASATNLFTSNHLQQRSWPVHVINVGAALERMLHDDTTAGQTYELYGPKNYSPAEIAELVDREIVKRRRHVNVPKRILKPAAHLLNKYLWWPTLSADEVEREFIDQEIDETAKTFKDLGIEPDELSNLTFHYLATGAHPTTTCPQLPSASELRRRTESSTPVILLKTKSSPHDGYDKFFRTRSYNPTFIPVLLHNFHHENLSQVKALFESGRLNPSPGRQYGGIIFTSQRAIEAFADTLKGVEQPLTEKASHLLPLYTVGPATARSLTSLRDKYLPHATIHGAETGNGENLAGFILDHYNGLFPPGNISDNDENQEEDEGFGGPGNARRKPPLLFLVGETRRDIIPKTLMGESTPEPRRIGVEEVVVYETGVVEGFEGDFETTLQQYSHGVVWVVVFSPTGCDAMVRVLRREVEKQGRGGRRVFVATIGPTTRDHLVKECGFRPEVCAAKPSPEGVGDGIGEFMRSLNRDSY